MLSSPLGVSEWNAQHWNIQERTHLFYLGILSIAFNLKTQLGGFIDQIKNNNTLSCIVLILVCTQCLTMVFRDENIKKLKRWKIWNWKIPQEIHKNCLVSGLQKDGFPLWLRDTELNKCSVIFLRLKIKML